MCAEVTHECVRVCVSVPDLQGQSRREKPVADSANLSWISPNQLNDGDVSQVQSTLSGLEQRSTCYTATESHGCKKLEILLGVKRLITTKRLLK